MSFRPYSPGTGEEHSELTEVIIANSTTINVGELVTINSSGFAANGSMAGTRVLGIAIGFVTSSDAPIPPAAYAAGTATQTNVTSVASASNNQTVAQQKVVVETSLDKKWSAQVNGTLGSTAASDQPGVAIDVDSADSNYDRVLETTATRTYTTVTNFFSWGKDSADSTRLVVSLRGSIKRF